MPLSRPSPYQQFREKWRDGCGSTLCPSARRIVFARGCIPCDVLFVGEAPGESENVEGVPFAGPAGMLLDRIIARAVPVPAVRIGFTNVVCCIPRDEDGRKAIEPDHEAILQCRDRLSEFVDLCKPRLVVCVGKLAKDYLDRGYKHSLKLPEGTAQIDVTHPAAILRANIAQQGLMFQRCVVQIANAVEEFCS
jgi:uracil-DNA glycosylase